MDQDGDLSQQTGERFFKELADFAPVMIWRSGLDAMCDWFNKPWLDFVGRQMEQEVGNGWTEGVHPEDFQRCLDTYMAAFNARHPFTMTYRLRRHDGVFREILDNGAAYYRDGTFAGYFGSCIDISDRAAVEAQLRQSQKMEAVGQLTGGLAHDFNNILTGIAGSLELLQTRLAQGRIGDLGRYLHAAQGATKRAAALTHRLLAFSRRQALDPKLTNINQLVTAMEDLVRRSVGPEIATEVVSASGLWSTLVDAGQLENALLNLCINARDAMPDGGKLVIETANRWFDDRAAREQDLPAGQYISLCVSDNGTGMDADTAQRAFDPFFTTKPLGQGTGLGLSMIYGFARQSGGQVRIYSEQGKGTMVCIYLPRHPGAAETPDLDNRTKPSSPEKGAGQTILVVDDEPLVRMFVTEILEELGYASLEAADGMSGLKILSTDTPIELLVTDVGLPNGMNGRQLADAARELRPELKVLFITGYAETALLHHGHLEPGMHAITKPFSMQVLAAKINGLIGAVGSRPSSK